MIVRLSKIVIIVLTFPLILFGQEKSISKRINLFPDEFSELDDVSISNHQKKEYFYKVLERARIKYLKALSFIERKDTAKAAENFEQAIDILNSISSYSGVKSNQDYLELVKAILVDYETYIQNINQLDEGSSLYLIRESLNKEMELSLQKKDIKIGLISPPNKIGTYEQKAASLNFTIPMEDNEYVQKSIEFLTQKPIGRKFIKGSLQRSGLWGGIIKKIILEEGMPPEIFYLAMVESGFNPFAVSRAKAVGMWQFISSTGKLYNLNNRNSVWIDERRDPIKSTYAAMRHLKDLYNQLGDWHLAISAYNCGINAVQRAISRLNSSDSVNFWNIMGFLPRETRNYVPLFIAVVKVATNPEVYGFTPEEVAPTKEINFDTYTLKEPVSLQAIAKCANVSVDAIKELNPELIVPFTPPDVQEYEIRIPFGSKSDFITKFVALKPEEKTPFHVYNVSKGETIQQIAEKFNVDIDQILLANNLSFSAKRLKKGTLIRIPVLSTKIDSPSDDDPSTNFNQNSLNSFPGIKVETNPDSVFTKENSPNTENYANKVVIRYFVKKGETLQSIAEKYKVEVDSIIFWNGIITQRVYENQPLRILIPSPNHLEDETNPITSKVNIDSIHFFSNTLKKDKKIHIVKKGETLEFIAKKYKLSVSDLIRWNPALKTRKKFILLAGEKLVYYLNPISSITKKNISNIDKIHIVRPGDTLSSIAREYGVSFNDLIKRNPKLNPERIRVGQKIYIR